MPKLLPILAAALCAFAAATPASAAPPAPDAAPVEVMVLGTWHFANPGLDLNNIKSDDVLAPARQAELAAVAEALAAFRPTKIMIERIAPAPDLADPIYPSFDAAMLAAKRDERIQIGYRLAHRLGLEKVYAIDEQPADGEPDYFPFGPVADFAKAHKLTSRLDGLMGAAAAETRRFEALQATHSMAELLAVTNDPGSFYGKIGGYYDLLGVGDTADQPGADLNAMWYLRNAKIFAKLMTVAAPGDRVLVVYGSGHNYWLRHFAHETPGFLNVDPVPYLVRAGSSPKK